MTALANASESPQEAFYGLPTHGVGPSATTYSDYAYRAAESLGLKLYPWQAHALDVMMAVKDDGSWLYREFAAVVARQNGKTELLVPRIVAGLREGERFVHTAHRMRLPREVFLKVALAVKGEAKIRYANGQEQIRMHEGHGNYQVMAAQKGIRGLSADVLIVDEVREFLDFDFMAAASPILTHSEHPQTIYLSNAGDEESIVLNDLRQRGLKESKGLAYLEWSAALERAVDDEEGWLEANPAVGYSTALTLDRLRDIYQQYADMGELAIFETEHLCRWVVSMAPRLLADASWQMCRRPTAAIDKPFMAVSVDPSGERVSVAYAWKQSDGSIGLMARDFTGSPISLTNLAVDLTEQAAKDKVQMVAFDPWTDQHLARHFPRTKPITGQEFANASERFVRAVETGQLRWDHAEAVSSDLPYVSRKEAGGIAWKADRAKSDRSITAALAAIRAVWLASVPQTGPAIY